MNDTPYRTITTSVVIEEQVTFTFAALCHASGADEAQMAALVEEGLLHPTGLGPHDWQFSGQSLTRARQALRLANEMDLSLHGAALVMDLLAQIQSLQSRLLVR